MVESDTWEREEDLRNAKELVDDFEGKLGTEVRQQVSEKKERKVKREEYKKMELLEKYMAKLLYGWNNRKFKDEYLKKLERNWKQWKDNRQINENEYLRRIEERKEEEKKKMNERDWRTGHFFRGEILNEGDCQVHKQWT